MPEAVIVATARTPIGRANKGSLVDCRPDDLSALIIDAVLAKVPSLDPALVEDVIWGCGQPAGEAGTNVARVAALLAGVEAPGVTCCGWNTPGAGGGAALSDITASCEQAPNANAAMSAATRDLLITMAPFAYGPGRGVNFSGSLPKSASQHRSFSRIPQKKQGDGTETPQPLQAVSWRLRTRRCSRATGCG